MPERVLVVQHQDDCPPGLLGEWAELRDVEMHVVRADRDELGDAAGHDGVVVLGSDKSVHDRLPWIERELAWLAALTRDTEAPVLGICFGAQALTRVLGGTVTTQPPEIEWVALPGAQAPIPAGPWLAWHNDFIEPPPGARTLARSPRALHAYATDRHLAVQFHPEVTPAIVEDWIGAEALGRDLARADVDLGSLRRDAARHAPAVRANAFALFDAFAAPGLRRPSGRP